MSEKVLPFYQDINGFRIPGAFSAEAYKTGIKYKPQADDLFVCTFPKCGTTWVQQIVTLLFNDGVSPSGYVDFSSRTPFLELAGTEGIEKMIRPGSIKIHLPFYLTPYSPDAKYLYVTRNPKDTVVSFYHHTRSNVYKYEKGEFNDFFEIFMDGGTDFGEYFDHVLSWYEHRDDPNVLFLTYEELKRDTPKMVKKIAHFMGPKYGSLIENDEFLNKVLKHSSVEFMKGVFNDSLEAISENVDKSPMDPTMIPAGLVHVMNFMAEYKAQSSGDSFKLIRKGIVGDWRNNFTEDQNRRMNEKIEAKLKETDLYKYWKSIDCI